MHLNKWGIKEYKGNSYAILGRFNGSFHRVFHLNRLEPGMFCKGVWQLPLQHPNSLNLSSTTGKSLGICNFSKPFLNLFTFLGLFNSWGVTSSICLPLAVWRSTSFGYYFKWLLSRLKCSRTQIAFPTGYSPQDAMSAWFTAPRMHIAAAVEVRLVIISTGSQHEEACAHGIAFGLQMLPLWC